MNMKIFAPLALFAGLMAGCTATPQTRTITAQVDGGADKMLYLDKFVSNQPVHVDSVKLDNEGRGVMKVPSMPLDFYSLNFGGKNMLVVLLDSAENLKFEANADTLQQPLLIEGSINTSLMHEYFKESLAFDKEIQPLKDRLNANQNDTAALQRYIALNDAFTARSKDFINAHMSSPAVLAALNRLNAQQDLPVFMAVRDSLRKSIPNSEYFVGFRDEVDRMEQQSKAALLQEEQQTKLDNLIPVGSEAPDFSQASPEGKQIALREADDNRHRAEKTEKLLEKIKSAFTV